MQRSRAQRFFAILVAIALLAYLFYMGTALFYYEPLVFSMKQADDQWANVQKDCQQLADAVPGLLQKVPDAASSDQTRLGSALTAFQQAGIPELQAPANLEQFTACEKAQDDLLDALTHFQTAESKKSELMKNLPLKLGQIRAARAAFNERAAVYNAKTRSFPCFIITSSFGFFPKPFFNDAPADAAVKFRVNILSPQHS